MKFTATHRPAANVAFFATGAALWVLLFRSPLQWLYNSLFAAEYLFHSIMLIGFLIYLGVRGFKQRRYIRHFQLATGPAVIFLFGIIGFLYIEKFINIDIFSCFFLGLTLYGFSGFVLATEKWKASASLVLLFFVCLPLSYHIETFLGFPLRIASAKIVGNFLSATGLKIESTEAILLLENSYAHIDLPCSGIKSLWSVTLLSIILSLIEHYTINAVWVISLVISLSLVTVANIFRIVLLVLLSEAALPTVIIDILHPSFGLVGFLVASGIAYSVITSFCRKSESRGNSSPQHFSNKSAAFVLLVLASALSFSELYSPAADAHIVPRKVDSSRDLDLTKEERDFFLHNDVISYQKNRFSISGITGTAFLVLSKSWRGHHHPEQCLQGQGHAIASATTLLSAEGLPVRSVLVDHSGNRVIYWFQSATDSTDDYSSRIWEGLRHPDKSYVMVSLYIEEPRKIKSIFLHTLISDFRRQAQTILKNEEKG